MTLLLRSVKSDQFGIRSSVTMRLCASMGPKKLSGIQQCIIKRHKILKRSKNGDLVERVRAVMFTEILVRKSTK